MSARQAVMAGTGVRTWGGVFKVWGSRGWELGQSGQVSQQKTKEEVTVYSCMALIVPAQQGGAEVQVSAEEGGKVLH